MKLEELRGETLRSFVHGMRKERLHGEAFRAFLESNLEFARWGFHLSHIDYAKSLGSTTAIYDSDKCRVRFDLGNIGRLPEEDELHVQYGRRHAPNDNSVMVWRGERCRCWHYSVPAPVLFVEGNSPRDIFAHRKKEGDYPYPHVLAAKNESEQDREFRNLYPPASVVWREVLIWQHCGHRLFDLFDLRRPELWEDYQKFIHEYYVEYERVFPPKRVGGDPALPRDRIC
jgi:hypothetical protein